jgi:UDP-N-acetylglucosamine--N-acetylmuramyl-(pentapeptide) pyrophosphoryl-undecaprenol N-acetylglucosamine transferase
VNRLLTPLAKIVSHGFPLPEASSKKHVYVGIPVRTSIQHVPYKPHTQDFSLLVVGGSQGAAILSEIVPKAIRHLPAVMQGRLHVVHQAHSSTLELARELYAKTAATVTVTPFIEDMGGALAESHLVISRAGSSTVGEILTVGRPSFLIPYPYATDDHQAKNAQCLYDQGACFMRAQADLKADDLTAFLETCLNHTLNLAHVAAQTQAFAKPEAAACLAKLLMGLAERKRIGS